MDLPYFSSKIGATSISEVRASWMDIISLGLGALDLDPKRAMEFFFLYLFNSFALSSSCQSQDDNAIS
jgi:hypothetical protein